MNDLEKYTLRIADSALILSHRLSEWCSRGPSLEEDIALSNISLDLLGQANSLLEYCSKINGKTTADDLAFKRNEREFYNFQICELENGHFGDTIIRQFLFDSYTSLFFKKLSDSEDETLSAIALKSIKEINYHLRHSSNWVVRLGDGRQGVRRPQVALDHPDLVLLAHERMLNGPGMRSARQTFCPIIFTRRWVSTKSFCAGSKREASPLCTPALPTCSAMA